MYQDVNKFHVRPRAKLSRNKNVDDSHRIIPALKNLGCSIGEHRKRQALSAAAARIVRNAEIRKQEVEPEAPSPIKRAKLRHQLNRLAERKMKAGEQLTREETKEVERRVRQRALRREKAARRNAQAVAKP